MRFFRYSHTKISIKIHDNTDETRFRSYSNFCNNNFFWRFRFWFYLFFFQFIHWHYGVLIPWPFWCHKVTLSTNICAEADTHAVVRSIRFHIKRVFLCGYQRVLSMPLKTINIKQKLSIASFFLGLSLCQFHIQSNILLFIIFFRFIREGRWLITQEGRTVNLLVILSALARAGYTFKLSCVLRLPSNSYNWVFFTSALHVNLI